MTLDYWKRFAKEFLFLTCFALAGVGAVIGMRIVIDIWGLTGFAFFMAIMMIVVTAVAAHGLAKMGSRP
jgi:hypothetical protein